MALAPRSFNASNLSQAPPLYKPSLVRLLSVMAFTETAVAIGLKEFQGNLDEQLEEHVEETMEEEFEHGRIAFGMLEEIGVSREESEKIVFDTVQPTSIAASTEWMSEGKDFGDLAAYSLLLDKAGELIIENYSKSSYAPWSAACAKILEQEEGHSEFGRQKMRELAEKDFPKAQFYFTKWLPLVLNFLGPPQSKNTTQYVELGLKKRDNEELRQDFFDYARKFAGENRLKIELKKSTYPFE